MRRYIWLLLASASGCDLVIPLTEPAGPVCGPYGAPVPLTFDASFTEPKYFSRRKQPTMVAGVAVEFGAIYATRSGITKVYIVQRQPESDTWNFAMGRNGMNALPNTLGGSMAEVDFANVDEMFVWQLETNNKRPFAALAPMPTAGYTVSGGPILSDSSFDITVGNVVEVLELNQQTMMMEPQRKRALFTFTPKDGMSKNLVILADREAPYNVSSWIDDPRRTDPINKDKKLEPGRGVITQDTFTLVYAAKYAGSSFDIYASFRDPDTKQWEVGQKVVGINTDASDEVDPWIDEDCSTLYFARDGVTYRAERVDD